MANKTSVKKSILYAANSVISNPWYIGKLFAYWIIFSILLVLGAGLIGIISAYAFDIVSRGLINNWLLFCVWTILVSLLGIFVLVFMWFAPTQLLLRFYDKGSQPFSFIGLFSLFNVKTALRLLVQLFCII